MFSEEHYLRELNARSLLAPEHEKIRTEILRLSEIICECDTVIMDIDSKLSGDKFKAIRHQLFVVYSSLFDCDSRLYDLSKRL